jgi:hypothetical protein
MTEEDEAFNDIERQAKQRKESVRAAVEKPRRPWVGLTIEEIAACCMESTTTQLSFYNAIEAKLKELNA